MLGQCRLCLKEAELQLGHIFPRFAVKWLKQTSATGFLRTTGSSKREQELERHYLMCQECEQLLCRDEKTFAEQVFIPYHERQQTVFEYGPWMIRFVAGLHWRVLAARSSREAPPKTLETFDAVQEELRIFLLRQSNSPGRAEFHLFLGGDVVEANFDIPDKINWYMSRSFDADGISSVSGTVGVYAKVLKLLTFSFLTPRNSKIEIWEGTQLADGGVLRTPQQVNSAGLGPFLEGRVKAVERALSSLPPHEKQRIAAKALKNPKRVLASQSYQTHLADRTLRRNRMQSHPGLSPSNLRQKGRDRNKPCGCGSKKKYKNCHGR
jgi:hypothetical protein